MLSPVGIMRLVLGCNSLGHIRKREGDTLISCALDVGIKAFFSFDLMLIDHSQKRHSLTPIQMTPTLREAP